MSNVHDKTGGGEFVRTVATFSTSKAGRYVENGYAIYPNALLFKAGDYPDKRFSMSPEEMWAAIDAFTPVSGNIEHSNFLKGRACHVKTIRFDDKDNHLLRGEVHVPLGLDELMEDDERKVSCEWDRASKGLSGMALVVNPRVPGASLISAFSAMEEVDPTLDDRIFAAFTDRKKHHHTEQTHQVLHDVIRVGYPAVCLGGPMTFPATPTDPDADGDTDTPPATMSAGDRATFGDMPGQLKSLRKIHSMTVEHGATCPGKPGTGKASMSDERTSDERSTMSADNALTKAVGALLPDKPTDDDIKAILAAFPAEYRPKLATFAAEAKPADRFAKFADDPEFIAFKAEQDRQLQAERDRIARLEADREADRKTAALVSAKAEAVRFCDSLGVAGEHASNLASLLFTATEIDRRSDAPKVAFSDGSTVKDDGKFADVLRGFLAELPRRDVIPMDANGQLVRGEVDVLFNDHHKKAEVSPDEARRRKEALHDLTPEGRAINERRKHRERTA